MKRILGIIIAIVLLTVLAKSVYIIDEREQAVMTKFGKPVGEPITKAGIKLKIPVVHDIHKFSEMILSWDGERGQLPTRDKTFLWVDTFARWRIVDALTFYKKVNNETQAQQILDGILDAAVRNVIASHELRETVRNTNREMYTIVDRYDFSQEDSLPDTDTAGTDSVAPGIKTALEKKDADIKTGRAGICRKIEEQARPKLQEFGVELIDINFKRINYVSRVRNHVYERMISERQRIAERLQSEGRGDSINISGKKDRLLKEIESEAYQKSETIKGKADAQATHIYAQAYNRNPELYSFMKSMDVYRSAFDTSADAVLSTDSELLKYLKDYQ